MTSETDGRLVQPYDYEDLRKSMTAYLTWEIDLIQQLEKDRSLKFRYFPPALRLRGRIVTRSHGHEHERHEAGTSPRPLRPRTGNRRSPRFCPDSRLSVTPTLSCS